jgi:diguanylate cyclase (GGDEF)-like protein
MPSAHRPPVIAKQYRSAALYLIIALALLVAAALYLILKEREQVWTSARRNTLNVAVGLQSTTTALLEQSARTLRGVASRFGQQPGRSAQQALAIMRDAAQFESVSAYLGFSGHNPDQFLLIDHEGKLAASDVLLQLQGRIPPASSNNIELHHLIQLPGNGAWYVPLTIGVARADARFDTAYALVPAQRVLTGTDSLRLLPDGWVSIVTTRGVRLLSYSRDQDKLEAVWPDIPKWMLDKETATPGGTFEVRGPVDGLQYIASWSDSDSLPFFVASSVPISMLYQLWLRQASAPGIVLLLGLVGVVVFAIRLRRSLVKQHAYVTQRDYVASHDTLTGLLNRDAFMRSLQQAITARPQEPFAVVLLDLNRFKDINDTLGHAAGDQVLIELGRRLSVRMPAEDSLVARLGGDELAVFSHRRAIAQELEEFCARLQAVIGSSMHIGAVELNITASMGAVLYPIDATTPVELLRCADIAVYAAKDELKSCVRYTPRLDNFTADMLALKSDFARALRAGEISVVYQPRVRILDGAWVGFEALSRWTHPRLGPVSPSKFVPLAENSELIHPFTQHVLKLAIRQAEHWHTIGYSLPVSVNISANNLLDHTFVDRLRELLRSALLPPHLLELEVTESAVMRNPETMLARLTEIRDLGVKLSIDDFGTGYASLAYLKRLPVAALKIDKSFVTRLDEDAGDQRIVKSSIQLAQGFGMTVVAEGVESAAAVERLREYGCPYAQGFHFACPLAGEEIEFHLRELRTGAGADSPGVPPIKANPI